MTKVTDERARFEKWAASNGYATAINHEASHGGEYSTYDTSCAWEGYQAALSSQGRVVSVEKVLALQAHFIDWRYEELEPCEWSADRGTAVVRLDDIRALIGEDHE